MESGATYGKHVANKKAAQWPDTQCGALRAMLGSPMRYALSGFAEYLNGLTGALCHDSQRVTMPHLQRVLRRPRDQ